MLKQVVWSLHQLILAGVFLANADTSLVVATYSSIASEFHNLGDGPWLLTVYTLGYSIALPAVSCQTVFFSLFGIDLLLVWSDERCIRTQDTASRCVLLVQHRMCHFVCKSQRILFSQVVRCLLRNLNSSRGTAFSLNQVIVGRLVSGLGGAGMTAMVSIIITGEMATRITGMIASLRPFDQI